MADEIYVFGTLRVAQGQRRYEFSNRDKKASLGASGSNDKVTAATIAVGTSAVTIPFAQVSAAKLGAFMISGVTTGAYIDLSLNNDGSSPFARLRSAATEAELGLAMLLIPLTGVTLYAKADAAGRKLDYLVTEAV